MSVPPCGIASRALTARFITTCSICPRSALTEIGPVCSFITTVTSSRVSRSSIVCISATTTIQIEQRRLDDLLPAEGEQLAGQPGRADAGRLDFRDVRPRRVVEVRIGENQFTEPEDQGQQIVEVVRHARRQAADRPPSFGPAETALPTSDGR